MEFLWESFPIFRRLLSLVLLSLLIPIGARLSAQGAPVSPDPKDHYWWNGFGLPVFDGPIYDLATYDGRLVAAGWFTQASGAIANHVAIWSGDQWHPLGSGPGGPVRRLAIQGKKLHAGGLGGVASWNGTEWTPVGVCPLLDVTALLATDDELVAAGRVGDRSSLVVRWDGETWTSVGDTIRGGVYDLAIYADELIACGDLTIPGDSLCHGLVARFDGVAWRRTLGGRSCFLVVGFGVDDFFATDLTVFGDDLIVSGYFDAVLDGRACSTVLSWDGNRWHCLAAGPPGMFATQLLDLDGQLIVGGFFRNEQTRSFALARWDGSAWHPIEEASGSWIHAFEPFEGELIVAGDLDLGQGLNAHLVASWDGSRWTALQAPTEDAGRGLTGNAYRPSINALMVHEGALIAGGDFEHAGSPAGIVPMRKVGEWNGSVWNALGSGLGSGYWQTVNAIARWQGDLIGAGRFEIPGVNGISALARWDGGKWFEIEGAPSGEARAIVYGAGQLIIGGKLSGPFCRGYCQAPVAWDGSHWRVLGSVQEDTTQNWFADVSAIAWYQGKLIVGGVFGGSVDWQRRRVLAWDGETWEPLGGGVDGHVSSMVVHDDVLVVGGEFQEAGGLPRPGLAVWDGTEWHSLGADSLREARVAALYSRGDDLIVGGTFRLPGEEELIHLARWDGERWHRFGSGLNGPVRAIIEHDSQLFLGGQFTVAGAKSSFLVARWDGDSRLAGAGSRLTLRRGYPNPTSSTITLSYALPARGPVQLTVHDLAGRRVAVLVDRDEEPGEHLVRWDGRAGGGVAAPGLYWARLRFAGGETRATKLVVVR